LASWRPEVSTTALLLRKDLHYYVLPVINSFVGRTREEEKGCESSHVWQVE